MTDSLIASPIRIQRRREKGWRKPPNTVCVDRTSRWGNPFVIGKHCKDAKIACALYAQMMTPYTHQGPRSSLEDLMISVAMMESIQAELRGKNLACFCPLDQPCHADFLLRIANEKEVEFT